VIDVCVGVANDDVVGVASDVIDICVGVADQLQTNYASDLRHMLKSVFDSYTWDVVARSDAAEDASSSLDDTFQQQTLPAHNFASFGSNLSSRSITSDETMQNNHHHLRSGSSLLGWYISQSFRLVNKVTLLMSCMD